MNREYQQQLNYIPYYQLMDAITIDADYQYIEWESILNIEDVDDARIKNMFYNIKK